MITISETQLKAIMPFASFNNIKLFCDPLNNAMQKYSINTSLRISAFLAQIAHESGSFRFVKEIASGNAYEGRKDLGNTQKGDGVKFKGRGLIQITGRANYTALSNDLNVDLVNSPHLLETPNLACLSACWFWNKKSLNILADADDFKGITKKINGGYNGWEDRLQYYNKAKKVLGVI
jgi:putative chitinase